MKRVQHALAGALGVRPGVQLVITNERVETHVVLRLLRFERTALGPPLDMPRLRPVCRGDTRSQRSRYIDRTAAATAADVHKRTAIGRVFQLG
jgi:hypothetical protein